MYVGRGIIQQKIHKYLKQTVVVVVVIQKYYVFSQLQCHHTYKCMNVCMYTRTYYGLTRINIDFLNVGCYFLGGSYSCCCSCNCFFASFIVILICRSLIIFPSFPFIELMVYSLSAAIIANCTPQDSTFGLIILFCLLYMY